MDISMDTAERGHDQVVLELIRAGANVNGKDTTKKPSFASRPPLSRWNS